MQIRENGGKKPTAGFTQKGEMELRTEAHKQLSKFYEGEDKRRESKTKEEVVVVSRMAGGPSISATGNHNVVSPKPSSSNKSVVPLAAPSVGQETTTPSAVGMVSGSTPGASSQPMEEEPGSSASVLSQEVRKDLEQFLDDKDTNPVKSTQEPVAGPVVDDDKGKTPEEPEEGAVLTVQKEGEEGAAQEAPESKAENKEPSQPQQSPEERRFDYLQAQIDRIEQEIEKLKKEQTQYSDDEKEAKGRLEESTKKQKPAGQVVSPLQIVGGFLDDLANAMKEPNFSSPTDTLLSSVRTIKMIAVAVGKLLLTVGTSLKNAVPLGGGIDETARSEAEEAGNKAQEVAKEIAEKTEKYNNLQKQI